MRVGMRVDMRVDVRLAGVEAADLGQAAQRVVAECWDGEEGADELVEHLRFEDVAEWDPVEEPVS